MFRSFAIMIITEEKLCEMVEKCAAKSLAEGILEMFNNAKKNQQGFVPGFYHIPQLEPNSISIDIDGNNQDNQRSRGFQIRQGRTIKDLIYYFQKNGSRLIGKKDANLVITALDYFFRNYDDYEDLISGQNNQ